MAKRTSLTVIQLNDSHAYFALHQEHFWQSGQAVYRPAGGYARIAAVVKQIRDANPERVLFCDCGDTLQGTYSAQSTQGQAMVPVLNSLGLDAMTAHWEFAYGPAAFKQRAAELSYPMVAINVYDQATKERFFPPYSVKEIGGLRIGLVGIASNNVDKTMPPSFSEGLEFTLGREELPSIIDVLRTQEKVGLIVLISHLGFSQDMKLLSEVQGIDVCLSGHTHNRLYKPALQGRTMIIQSGCHGSFLGCLDLEIDGGRVIDYRHQLIKVEAKINSDPEVDDLVRQAIAPYQDELSTFVGKTATVLNRATTLETTMDNFLLQALLESTGAQLAFSNGWRYGAPIIPGEITLNAPYNMIPYMSDPVDPAELGWLASTLLWESARPYLYLRSTGDGRLLVGGEDDDHDIPARRDRLVDRKAATLRRKVSRLFPHLHARPAFAWAGTFAETSDGLPLFGRHPQYGPRVLFALAYGGNGINYSMLGAGLLRAQIERRPHPLTALFSFSRLGSQ